MVKIRERKIRGLADWFASGEHMVTSLQVSVLLGKNARLIREAKKRNRELETEQIAREVVILSLLPF